MTRAKKKKRVASSLVFELVVSYVGGMNRMEWERIEKHQLVMVSDTVKCTQSKKNLQ